MDPGIWLWQIRRFGTGSGVPGATSDRKFEDPLIREEAGIALVSAPIAFRTTLSRDELSFASSTSSTGMAVQRLAVIVKLRYAEQFARRLMRVETQVIAIKNPRSL